MEDHGGRHAGGAGRERYEARPGRPHPVTHNPLVRIGLDIRDEWRARGHFPPGRTRFSARRTYGIVHDPLPILLGCYEEFGPVFSTRLFHGKQVWMLGPEANNYVLVTHPQNFVWRDGSFGDLIPLLGDGLLTIDGDYHDRARRIMMPAFHSEQINASHTTRHRGHLRLDAHPGDADRHEGAPGA